MLVHTNPLGIATGEQRRAGRRTHRGGHHEARELPAFLGNTVDIRCTDGLGTKTAQVAVALVIGKDDDEVRFSGQQSSTGKKKSPQSKGQERVRLSHMSCLEVGYNCFI